MKMFTKVYYSDENLLRYRMIKKNIEKLLPLIKEIIEQGNREGVFDVSFPKETAELILSMFYNLSDRVQPVLISEDMDSNLDCIKRLFRSFEQAVERILGVKKGRVRLFDFSFVKKFKIKEKK